MPHAALLVFIFIFRFFSFFDFGPVFPDAAHAHGWAHQQLSPWSQQAISHVGTQGKQATGHHVSRLVTHVYTMVMAAASQ